MRGVWLKVKDLRACSGPSLARMTTKSSGGAFTCLMSNKEPRMFQGAASGNLYYMPQTKKALRCFGDSALYSTIQRSSCVTGPAAA